MRVTLRNFVVLFVVVAAAGGCREEPKGVELGTVSGTVTLGGNPLASALVTFTPSVDGSRTSIGVTDANGRYTLQYTQATNGAAIGQHEVRLSTAAVDGAAKERVPSKYVDENTLSASVQGGENVINFDL